MREDRLKRDGLIVGRSNNAMDGEVVLKQDNLIDGEESHDGRIMMEWAFSPGEPLGFNAHVDSEKKLIYYGVSQQSDYAHNQVKPKSYINGKGRRKIKQLQELLLDNK